MLDQVNGDKTHRNGCPPILQSPGFALAPLCNMLARTDDGPEMTTTDKDENDVVSQEVALLLKEIEKEAVPDRLLVLAKQLQKALNDRKPQS